MKFSISILLALCFTLTACQSSSPDSGGTTSAPAPKPTPNPAEQGGGGGRSNPHSHLNAQTLTKSYIKSFSADAGGLTLSLNKYQVLLDMIREAVLPNDRFEVRIFSCSSTSVINRICERKYVFQYRAVVYADYRKDVELIAVKNSVGEAVGYEQLDNWYSLSIAGSSLVQVAFEDVEGLTESEIVGSAQPSPPSVPPQPVVGPLSPLPPIRGLDEFAKAACLTYSTPAYVNDCANELRNLPIDPLAAKLCSSYSTPSYRQDCLKSLGGKAFSPTSMAICDGFGSPTYKEDCAKSIGSYQFDPTDLELCRKYGTVTYRQECLEEKMNR